MGLNIPGTWFWFEQRYFNWFHKATNRRGAKLDYRIPGQQKIYRLGHISFTTTTYMDFSLEWALSKAAIVGTGGKRRQLRICMRDPMSPSMPIGSSSLICHRIWGNWKEFSSFELNECRNCSPSANATDDRAKAESNNLSTETDPLYLNPHNYYNPYTLFTYSSTATGSSNL